MLKEQREDTEPGAGLATGGAAADAREVAWARSTESIAGHCQDFGFEAQREGSLGVNLSGFWVD